MFGSQQPFLELFQLLPVPFPLVLSQLIALFLHFFLYIPDFLSGCSLSFPMHLTLHFGDLDGILPDLRRSHLAHLRRLRLLNRAHISRYLQTMGLLVLLYSIVEGLVLGEPTMLYDLFLR